MASIIAIALGAAAGALLRWGLGLRLNPLFPPVPPGTLVANLMGSYIIGAAVAYFAQTPNVRPTWKLLIITGFCGGLTTFSTFAAEVVTLLQQDRFIWAMVAISIHVVGALAMTFVGMVSWHKWRYLSCLRDFIGF